MTDKLDIMNAVAHIEALNGGAFVAPPLTASVRMAGEDLARYCGVDTAIIPNVTDAHLVSLYSVCRRKSDSYGNVVRNINKTYGGITGQPSAPVPSGVPTIDMGRVNAAIEAVQSALKAQLAPMQRAVDGIPDSVVQAVADGLAALAPTQLTITRPNALEPVALGLVHYRTEAVLKALNAGVHVYLHGPAGSGKTTMAQKCAEALNLPFYAVAKVENEYLLLGFENAAGHIVRTPFREAYEHGGLLLFDELDGSGAGAIVAMNMALANKMCPFPDKLVPMHPDFRCIAAGNTTLSGATRQYAGRNQLDGASVDRFFFMRFGYDEKLELAIAPNKVWCRHVQAVRAIVAERGMDHLVTPRATLDGSKLLAEGMAWDDVEEGCIFKGLDEDTIDQIRSHLRLAGNARIQAA